MTRPLLALAALLCLNTLGLGAAANAVVITEAAWRAAGGSERDWSAGFAAHDALAARAPFRAMVAFTQDDREGEWGIASGVWLGNHEGHGYVLTAGHVVTDGTAATAIRVRSTGGTIRRGVEVFVHPAWNNEVDTRGGMDFAILKLDGPIADSGPAPTLYSGRHERGRRAVMIGAGVHGVAPFGHGYRFGPTHGAAMTAAENVIDQITPYAPAEGEQAEWGNYITLDLDQPDGTGKNRTGDVQPISALEGVLAPGDSGGSLWAEFDGQWRIVGVNSSGDPGADYQDVSHFARVTTVKGWIRSVFPNARFAGGKLD